MSASSFCTPQDQESPFLGDLAGFNGRSRGRADLADIKDLVRFTGYDCSRRTAATPCPGTLLEPILNARSECRVR